MSHQLQNEEPEYCDHPVGRLFDGGVETRALVSRRAELTFLRSQTIQEHNRDNSNINSEQYVRAPNKNQTQVHFPDPVVTSSRSRSPEELTPPLPKVVTAQPLSGLIRSVANVSRLFSPRRSPAVSPVRTPSAEASLTWDPFPFASTSQRARSTSSESDSVYEDSVSWPHFEPVVHRQGTRDPQVKFLPLRSRSSGPQVRDLLTVPSPRRRSVPELSLQRQTVHQKLAIPEPVFNQPLPLLNRQLNFDEEIHAQNPVPVQVPHNQVQIVNAPLVIELPVVQVPAPVHPNILDEDIDYFDNMANSNTIPVFRGMHNEDSRDWIESATLLVDSQRTPNEKAKIALAGISLADDAKRWFRTLDIRPPHPGGDAPAYPPEAITTFAQFKEQFLARFQRARADLWREQAQLHACRQRVGQSTQDYLNELQELAGRALATPEQVLSAALSGLRSDVKLFCVGHELQTLGDLQRWSNIYDTTVESRGQDVAGAVDRLERLVDKLQVRAVTPSPRTPSPQRQVRFANDDFHSSNDNYARSPPMPRYERSTSAPTSAASYGSWRDRGRSSRGNYGGHRGVWGASRQRTGVFDAPNQCVLPSGPSPSFQVPSQYYGTPPQFQGARRPAVNLREAGFADACGNCGRRHVRGQCPARSSVCRACGKIGHWYSVCRSSRQLQA